MAGYKSCFAGETILVVDDDRAIVDIAGLLLKRSGFKVLSAHDGRQCLQMVEKHAPALVLLDYMMPVMNGLDALKQIRSNFPDTYVIMFTGKGNEEIAVELMRAGASDYLCKPFAKGSMQERIDAVLSLRKVEIENRALLHERELLQLEIEQWNVKLEQRVREKSRALAKAHKEIVQSEKLAALGHISAGMAHEIRNPLNSINLFAQILLTADCIDEENRGYVHKITQEVERIDETLIQMLASNSGDINKQKRVDLSTIIDKIISDYRPRIDTQNIALDLDIDRSVPTIAADSLEIEQVFTNLIGNALYEMANGGTLTIKLHADAEKMVITVADSGAGILPENLQHIFDPFFTTKEKGTGFGLSVVMRIVNSLGGKISASSPPGLGASFLLELPLLPASVH